MAGDALAALHDVIRRHKVTYAEYDALKAWLIQVGQDGEWPLFLDVWLEHVVEEVANADREGAEGTIEGPYYVPGAPESEREATLPMRDGEAGHAAAVPGHRHRPGRRAARPGARSSCGTPTPTASTRSSRPASRSGTCAGSVRTGADGAFAIHTIQPAPYQIPTDGSCGTLIAAAGWHAWRPAHLHVKVVRAGPASCSPPSCTSTAASTSTDDVAQAVKPELVLRPTPASGGEGVEVTYDFALDPA